MKKIYLILIANIDIITGVYLYVRFSVLKTKDFKPDSSKARSVLDLRPSIIAKLQQLVKDGSDGLYHLSIGKIEPHILKSTLDIMNATLSPDSAELKNLDNTKKLPDDVFKISFSTLHIEGIDINDLLSKNHLSLKDISITDPVIEVYHKKRRYNKNERIKNDSVTLYQKIMKKMKRISINNIEVLHGTFINHNLSKKNHTTKLNDISINMNNVLIDSSTQFDKRRFLFAERAQLSTKNFSGRTPDSLYFFKCGSIDISTAENDVTALNIELHPRGNKQQFESKLSERREMYNMVIPKITLSDINWWDLTNEETIIANEAVINSSTCSIFLDRSLPFRKVGLNNFPHQILMRIPIPVSISKIYFHHSNLSYTEYNPGMDKTGTIYIDDINGEVTNITNIPAQIKHHKLLTLKSSGLFMHKIPITDGFQFDLSKYKTGDFSMDLDIGEIDTAILNPIAEPLGEFMLKKGSITRGIAHVKGDNFKATGKGQLLYKDLYLVGLKKDKNKPGNIKKKTITSFLGNVFLIKNDNPSKGKPSRVVDFAFQRERKTTFFSLIWKTIFLAILKTIGLPASFADKPY